MKTEEERIRSIVDELQSGPFQKYDVRIHISPKKKENITPAVKTEEERKEQQQRS